MRASIQGKHVPDERFTLAWRYCSVGKLNHGSMDKPTLAGNHVRNLDNGINLGLRKDALPTSTLDIEA